MAEQKNTNPQNQPGTLYQAADEPPIPDAARKAFADVLMQVDDAMPPRRRAVYERLMAEEQADGANTRQKAVDAVLARIKDSTPITEKTEARIKGELMEVWEARNAEQPTETPTAPPAETKQAGNAPADTAAQTTTTAAEGSFPAIATVTSAEQSRPDKRDSAAAPEGNLPQAASAMKGNEVLNNRTRWIILATILVIAAMCLFPPWTVATYPLWRSSATSFTAEGYHWILWQGGNNPRIDVTRLVVQCFLVCLLSGAGLFYSAWKRKP